MSAIWVLSSSCGVAGLHLGDDALVLQHLELLVHGDPAGLAPRVADRGVGEADLLARLSAANSDGVGHLAVDVLQPGLRRVALEGRRRAAASCSSKSAWTNHSSLDAASRSSSAAASAVVVRRVVGAAGRQHGQRRGGRERAPSCNWSAHQLSPVFVPGVGVVCGRVRAGRSGLREAGAGAARAAADLPGAGGGGDGDDDDQRPARCPARWTATPRTVSRVKSSSSAKAPAAAESTQPRPPPRSDAAEDDRGDRGELVALRRPRGARRRTRRGGSRRRWPTSEERTKARVLSHHSGVPDDARRPRGCRRRRSGCGRTGGASARTATRRQHEQDEQRVGDDVDDRDVLDAAAADLAEARRPGCRWRRRR